MMAVRRTVDAAHVRRPYRIAREVWRSEHGRRDRTLATPHPAPRADVDDPGLDEARAMKAALMRRHAGGIRSDAPKSPDHAAADALEQGARGRSGMR